MKFLFLLNCLRLSVVCHVDVGVGARHRRKFLQRLSAVKATLVPTPSFIIIHGDEKNRRGGALDRSLGCSERNLTAMKDGDMKRRLETAAYLLEELRQFRAHDALQNLGKLSSPPSPGHSIVMEAVIILLKPWISFEKHVPLSSLRGIAWAECRRILSCPSNLWGALIQVDMFGVPPANIRVVKVSDLPCRILSVLLRKGWYGLTRVGRQVENGRDDKICRVICDDHNLGW